MVNSKLFCLIITQSEVETATEPIVKWLTNQNLS